MYVFKNYRDLLDGNKLNFGWTLCHWLKKKTQSNCLHWAVSTAKWLTFMRRDGDVIAHDSRI
jgi:hypothetical protein